jgi:hypothetical protein
MQKVLMDIKRDYSGAIFSKDRRAKITWELRRGQEGPRFSAQGSFPGGGGQCLDTIEEMYPDDERIREVCAVWRKYHLNNMKPGTKEHARAGCAKGKHMPLVWDDLNEVQRIGARCLHIYEHSLDFKNYLTMDILGLADMPAVAFNDWLSRAGVGATKGPTQQIIQRRVARILDYTRKKKWHLLTCFPLQLKRGILDNLYAESGGRSSEILRWWLCNGNQILNSWVECAFSKLPDTYKEPRFLKDSLGYPCPDTGALYGHAWYYHPIPDDVLGQIVGWEERFQEEGLDQNASPQALYIREWAKQHDITCSLEETTHLREPARPDWAVRAYVLKVTRAFRNGVFSKAFPYYTGGVELRGPDAPWETLVSLLAEMLDYKVQDFESYCELLDLDSDSRKAHEDWKRAQDIYESLELVVGENALDDLDREMLEL